jgi:hypothetical protein
MRDQTIAGGEDGAWRLASAADVALLEWGVRKRARWEKARARVLDTHGPRAAHVIIAATRDDDDYNDEIFSRHEVALYKR